MRTRVTLILAAVTAALAVAVPTAGAVPVQHYGVVGFIDSIHETHAGATQDTQWTIPVSQRDPANPCSFRSEMVGRQEVEFRAPGQWGRFGSTQVAAITQGGTFRPSTIDAPAQVERHVKLVVHLEDITPACDTSRRPGPAPVRQTQTTELPGCGIVPGTMHVHLAFVDRLRKLRVRGEFEPNDGGDLDQIFGQCSLLLLPGAFADEKAGGILQHDYPVTTRNWWRRDLPSGAAVWAQDTAHRRGSDFFRPGSTAFTVLSMSVHLQRHEHLRRPGG